MFKANIPYPRNAVQRIQAQVAHPGPLQSCKSEIIFPCPTGADLNTYNLANPGNEAHLLISDAYQILPYSTLDLVFLQGALATTPYQQRVAITPALTAPQVAQALVDAFNLWVATYRAQFPDVASGFAHIYYNSADAAQLEMPWGMLAATTAVWSGPAPGAVIPGNSGVDNPVLAGIVGPRRHIQLVTPGYRDDYYGDIQIG